MSSFAFARERKRPAKVGQSSDRSKDGLSTPGMVRLKKDINELDLPTTMQIKFDGEDVSKFHVEFVPTEGPWKNGKFEFLFEVPVMDYPHKPPTVQCLTRVYHPNINLEGKICLSILREDWKPFYTITSVLQSLQLLFTELVNPDDPLNKDAAQLMKAHPSRFQSAVTKSIAGGVTINGIRYYGNLAR